MQRWKLREDIQIENWTARARGKALRRIQFHMRSLPQAISTKELLRRSSKNSLENKSENFLVLALPEDFQQQTESYRPWELPSR